MKTNIICPKCDEAFSVEYSKYSSKKTVECPTCGTTIDLPKKERTEKDLGTVPENPANLFGKIMDLQVENRYIFCGIICSIFGFAAMLLSVYYFTIYVPFFVLVLVFGILAIVDKKTSQGLWLIAITILVAAFLQSFLFNREVEEVFKGAGMDVDKTIEEMNESFKDLDKMNKDMQQQLNSLFKPIPKK